MTPGGLSGPSRWGEAGVVRGFEKASANPILLEVALLRQWE